MRRGRRIVVALWAVAVFLVLAIAIALVLGGTGLWTKKPHADTAVAAYIKRVDALQQQLRLPLTQLLTSYRRFSTQAADPLEQARLDRAVRTFQALERRLGALPAPQAATRLRRQLTELVRADVGVAREVEALAVFTPQFRAATRDLTTAGKTLSGALAAAAPPKPRPVRGTKKRIAAAQAAYAAAATRAANEQADAIDAYDRSLAAASDRLRTLVPPSSMAPVYNAQLQTVEATARAGATLAHALRTPTRTNVSALSRRFIVASRFAGSLAAQRAEIAAIKAYNARVLAIGAKERAIQLEIKRLQRLEG